MFANPDPLILRLLLDRHSDTLGQTHICGLSELLRVNQPTLLQTGAGHRPALGTWCVL